MLYKGINIVLHDAQGLISYTITSEYSNLLTKISVHGTDHTRSPYIVLFFSLVFQSCVSVFYFSLVRWNNNQEEKE